jgi:MFS family permease
VMRHFAGTLVHKLSLVGLLWVSCLLAALGLVALSFANSPITGLLGATIWGVGVCYMWPTMLAAAAERFPKSGAFGMGLIGTAGALSIQFVLPLMGKLYDKTKIEQAGGEKAYDALAGAARDAVDIYAATFSFRMVAVLPAVLLIAFAIIYLRDKATGFKGEKIS